MIEKDYIITVRLAGVKTDVVRAAVTKIGMRSTIKHHTGLKIETEKPV